MKRDEAFIQRLKEMVGEGLSFREIGERMGKPRNTIACACRRYGIKSVMKMNADIARMKARAAAMPSRKAAKKKKQAAIRENFVARKPLFVEAGPYTGPIPERPDRDARYGHMHCQFISGDVTGGDYEFCEQPRYSGHPYCEDHCRRCYAGIGKAFA